MAKLEIKTETWFARAEAPEYRVWKFKPWAGDPDAPDLTECVAARIVVEFKGEESEWELEIVDDDTTESLLVVKRLFESTDIPTPGIYFLTMHYTLSSLSGERRSVPWQLRVLPAL